MNEQFYSNRYQTPYIGHVAMLLKLDFPYTASGFLSFLARLLSPKMGNMLLVTKAFRPGAEKPNSCLEKTALGNQIVPAVTSLFGLRRSSSAAGPW